ncbi:MAG: hypothetical protein AMJ84_05105 [Acidithiobacillales bacterium SM23_46]|jgi:hypothetical protein|nr:MAG: hypothetical protein AMS22_16860 [Thiotrichales bacterium SG8_50]KPK72007.1 MAG: hypothetical protein AMJ84_05105 [Acidithiobacillales bacterium SM23_46]KPL28817.1 MAG: hypothetical protein AMJ72_01375 [Acidithiobacillales bacterium SM1_46]
MSKERRENQRLPVEFDAVLNYQQHAIICTVRDISLNGAFVETMPDSLPTRNTHVEIGFSVLTNGQNRYLRIPGRIAYIKDNGAGVRFSEVGMDAYMNLVDMVYEA